ncbi:uncharacterized protein LOC142558119 [Dermacentor variabilis]|uniref:uncharacterized protein LOC142558119 n=1 Tax=Dermacentor variabilis TaxID=34621 RepID=UPI003F5CB643
MTEATYTLSGFGSFLERRRVTFVEPLPAFRVCSICGVVTSSTRLLPCCHVVCDGPCGRQVHAAGSCPLDGRTVTTSSIVPFKFEQSELEQLLVRCLNCADNCTFAGKLSELGDHLCACECDAVECPKCGERVCRNEAASHCNTCCDSATSMTRDASGTNACAAVEEIARMKQDLEELREFVSKAETVKVAIANDVNSLAERAERFETQLMSVAQEVADLKRPLPARAMNAGFPHGLHRSASKSCDCALTLYKIGKPNSQCGSEVIGELCTLKGYTFRVSITTLESQYKFQLFFCSGLWDDYVDWPFASTVKLRILHPRDKTKDATIPAIRLKPEPYCCRKPPRGSYNNGIQFKELYRPFIHNGNYMLGGNLYLSVEFFE